MFPAGRGSLPLMGIVNAAGLDAKVWAPDLITPHGDCKLGLQGEAVKVGLGLITPHGDCKPRKRQGQGRASTLITPHGDCKRHHGQLVNLHRNQLITPHGDCKPVPGRQGVAGDEVLITPHGDCKRKGAQFSPEGVVRLITPHGDCKPHPRGSPCGRGSSLITPHGDCKLNSFAVLVSRDVSSLPLMGIVNALRSTWACTPPTTTHYPSWGL